MRYIYLAGIEWCGWYAVYIPARRRGKERRPRRREAPCWEDPGLGWRDCKAGRAGGSICRKGYRVWRTGILGAGRELGFSRVATSSRTPALYGTPK